MPKTHGKELRITAGRAVVASAEGQKGKRFDLLAYSGEPFRQWWSRVSVVVDLDTLRLPTVVKLPILYDHRSYDADCVAGQAETVEVVDYQLRARGPIFSGTPGGQKVIRLAEEGHEWQVSIGADSDRIDSIKPGDKVTVNGREYTGPIDIARGTDLREISFVVIGAAKNTRALVAHKPLAGGSMDFDTWVQSLGFTPGDLDDTQRANLQKMFDAEYGEDETDEEEPGADPLAMEEDEDEPMAASADELRLQAAAELIRQHDIRQVCAQYHEPTISVGQGAARRTLPLAAYAIAENWTREQAEIEALRSRRPGQVDIVRDHDRDCSRDAIQGALILRAGGRLDHPSYAGQGAIALKLPSWLRAGINADARQRAMEAAHRYADYSAVDLCREALRVNGQECPHGRSDMIQAAFSGGALTNVFTTNVNAILLATYQEYGDTTTGWTKETDVADFRTQERPRLLKGASLSRHPRGKEADHVSRSDTGESYKIGRYTGQFVVDEQDIIDDRLNALADMPVEMGLAAARLRPDLVYAILFANAALADGVALFHSTHANTDTTAALAADKLKAGVTAMRKQRENGVNLNLMPTHLITPTVLDFTARELINSTTIVIAGTAGSVTERGVINTLNYLGLQPVSDARLDNGVTDPSSGTSYSGDANDWFLASAMAQTIEVGYLRGTGRAPQVRSFVLDKGRWGAGWDIAMDVGAKALDYKGFYRGQG